MCTLVGSRWHDVRLIARASTALTKRQHGSLRGNAYYSKGLGSGPRVSSVRGGWGIDRACLRITTLSVLFSFSFFFCQNMDDPSKQHSKKSVRIAVGRQETSTA